MRPATPADAPRLVELWWQLTEAGEAADARYTPRPDARSIGRSLIEGWLEPGAARTVLVADLHGVVAGFLTAKPADEHPVLDLPPTLVITDAIVDAHHRGKGIGRALIDAVRVLARDQGYTAMEVGTLALDQRAVAFWHSTGFDEWRATLHRTV